MRIRDWSSDVCSSDLPGCVYHLLPGLAEHYGLDEDGRAWLAWLNGNTQNPVTSILLLEASGGSIAGWEKAVAFWNEHFRALEWDTDRRHQKYKFGEATSGFASLVGTAPADAWLGDAEGDRKSTRLHSSH